MHTGLGIVTDSFACVSFPVSLSIKNVIMLFAFIFATIKYLPVGSIEKSRGCEPWVEV